MAEKKPLTTDGRKAGTNDGKAQGGGKNGQSILKSTGGDKSTQNKMATNSEAGVKTPITKDKIKWSRLSTKELLLPNGQTKAVNGVPSSKKIETSASDSLSVPLTKDGCEGSNGSETAEGSNARKDSSSPSSRSDPLSVRRESVVSFASRMSNSGIDFSKIHAANLAPDTAEVDETESKSVVTTDDSYIRSAIPILPVGLASLCLVMNMLMPGTGTVISGFSVFCCGKPRIHTKDDDVGMTFCVNVWVGFAQMFTVPLMMVGWFWAFTWGIYMVILATDSRRIVKQHREKQLQAIALTAFSTQVRPWTLRT